MKITNTTYNKCLQCGIEARGFKEIYEKFGYKMKRGGVVEPYSVCKKCSDIVQQEKNHNVKDGGKKNTVKKQTPLSVQWLSSAEWARKMHVRKEVFVSYLLELGYLEEHPDKEIGIPHMITEKGREHSALTNPLFYKTVLWDYQAFSDVLMYRASLATHSMHCPHCRRELECHQVHEDFFKVEEKCPYCGKSSETKKICTVFDR